MLASPQKLFRLFAAGFGLIGLGLLAGAFYSYRSTEAWLRGSATAAGTVIGYERRTDGEGAISYFPVITFTPANGDEVEFTSSTGGNSRGYAIGASVPLRYNPALPFEATIDTPLDRWITAGVLGILGLVFALVGAALLWLFRPSGPLDPPERKPKLAGTALEPTDYSPPA